MVSVLKEFKILFKRKDTAISVQFSSVAQFCLTLCNPIDCRPPCPSPTPGVYSDSCPLSRWYHPTISSSVSSHLQSFPASGSFQTSQIFASGGQSIGISSASTPVLPVNIQGWFISGLTGLIPLLLMELSSLLQHHNLKASILQPSAFFMVLLSQPYMTPGKTIPLAVWIFVSKVISLLFNTPSRFVIAFLPRSKNFLILMCIVILEPKKNKIYHCFHFFPIYLPWSDGTRYHNLCFRILSFKPSFSLSFHLHQETL